MRPADARITSARAICATTSPLRARWPLRDVVRPLSRSGEIKCPMYLFFGAKDQLIPMDQVGQINTELTTKKVPFQMKIYPEAGHGFNCDDRGSYHEASAKDAWEKTKSFFAQHLK